jgi:hypothetical protein
MIKNGHAKNHVFYESKRPSRQNWGVVLFRKTVRLSSARGFYKSERGVEPQKEGRGAGEGGGLGHFHERRAVFTKLYRFSQLLTKRKTL